MGPTQADAAYAGPRIVTPSTVLDDYAVIVRGGIIEAVVPTADVPPDTPLSHLDGAYLAPGFIDIHVHGAAGRSYNEGTAEAAAQIGTALLRAGVTTALPTLASAPIDQLSAALEMIEGLREPSLAVASTTTTVPDRDGSSAAAGQTTGAGANRTSPWIPGAHLEGPYFSPAQAGAQDRTALRTPSDGSVPDLLAHAPAISLLSFAPELQGSVRLTEQLVEAGIVAAAGHSDGTAEDLAACQAAGLSHVIHIFSGQSTICRQGPWRVPGLLEATLASDGLTVEMIGDGKHLPPLLMRLAHRALGDRLCLVSDATAGAGMADGSTYRMGEMTYRVRDGVGFTRDGTAFGGSTTLLPQMLPIVRPALGLTVPEAIAMVTSIPAQAARLSGVGRLEAGYWADLTVLDETLTPQALALRGQWHTSPPGKEHP